MKPRRTLAAYLCVVSIGAIGSAWGLPGPVPASPPSQIIEPGYAFAPYATGITAPTSLQFGPDGNLYVATVAGTIYQFQDVGGLVSGTPVPFVSSLTYPLGIAWGKDGNLYSTSVDIKNKTGGRTWGEVVRIPVHNGQAGTPQPLLVDLPNGHSQANGIAFGPDGLLYVNVGSSTDDGINGGPPEIAPISGGILRFDAIHQSGSPLSGLRYRGSGATPEDAVDVAAFGFRNHYDLAFRGSDLYVSQNGPETEPPLGDDVLLRSTNIPARALQNGTADNFGFPGCIYTHDAKGWPVPTPATLPDLPADQKTCAGVTPAIASFGLHPSADGLAFAPTDFGARSGDLFVAEWGSFTGYFGHKVVRVGITSDGSVRRNTDGTPDQSDFFAADAPIDLTFHNGKMYVADYGTGSVMQVFPTGL